MATGSIYVEMPSDVLANRTEGGADALECVPGIGRACLWISLRTNKIVNGRKKNGVMMLFTRCDWAIEDGDLRRSRPWAQRHAEHALWDVPTLKARRCWMLALGNVREHEVRAGDHGATALILVRASGGDAGGEQPIERELLDTEHDVRN
ncbi:hypothetical protein C0992_008383, partial [Termitomyces sp. T32_za158]